jgi:hypothetical protein
VRRVLRLVARLFRRPLAIVPRESCLEEVVRHERFRYVAVREGVYYVGLASELAASGGVNFKGTLDVAAANAAYILRSGQLDNLAAYMNVSSTVSGERGQA